MPSEAPATAAPSTTTSPPSAGTVVRPITPDEVEPWLRALHTGFLRPPTPSPEYVAWRTRTLDPPRTLGAFDGDRCVGTLRSFPQRLTAVGGAEVAADAISNVTVSPTHRRRGLLGRMMARDLAAARERGEVVATLIAAEYPIYGRFGFGPAASVADFEIDVPRTGLGTRWSGPGCGGRIELVDAAEVRESGPALHDRLRAGQPGAVDRDAEWWARATGAETVPEHPWREPFHAVYRSASGEVEGLLVYSADDAWSDAKQPQNTATVHDLIALGPAAERALWHFLCSVDWITKVRTGHRAVDSLLPELLPDPRAARITTRADWLWVRILDVVRALETRSYEREGTLVLEVHAPEEAPRRYRLAAGPDGASCVPVRSEPDLVLDVRELGALWLGEGSAVRLGALGRIAEETPGALALADGVFRTARGPWCPDVF
ncbi:GNAT family N-acetyltransferase [Streptomyces sp. NPDC058045]|uniref:GNAT family N-acetyltransferase n=1 Tax=Streptomyces sp. NPDC058045 TaxID=3346311 RepID=UPI0036EB5753